MTRGLLGLPKEILLALIDHTPNADLDSFTSTCKIIRKVAARALHQHGQRKRRYRYITYGDPDVTGDNTTWVHPTLMLRDLLKDDLMCYPTELHINDHAVDAVARDDGRNIYDDGVQDEEWEPRRSEVDTALESLSKAFEPLVRACPYLQNDEVDLKQAILNEGDIGATLGFLLTLLQNLKTLHITDYDMRNFSGKYLGAMDFVVDKVVIDTFSSSPSSTHVKPLGQLREIIFTCGDKSDRINYSLDLHASFFYLPSIRTVRLLDIRTGYTDFFPWDYPGINSEIETLSIFQSVIDNVSLQNYLKLTKHLRSFQYTPRCQRTAFSTTQLLPYIVGDLLKYACASLRYLYLTDIIWGSKYEDSGDGPFCSLKGFQALRSIRIGVTPTSWKMEQIVEDLESESPSVSLTQMLPASAERVVFGDCMHRVKALTTLQELSRKEKTQLPHLKFVSFEFEHVGLGDGQSLQWVQSTIQAFNKYGEAITADVNKWVIPEGSWESLDFDLWA